jgi:hypothetical protein
MRLIFLGSLLTLASCATSFHGDAHLTPKECQVKCDSWGMELDGMVAMGEYSDACICTKNRRTSKASPVGGGAVGVILQKMAQDQAQANRIQSF